MLSLRVQRGLALFQKVQKKENAGVSSRRKPLSSGCARSSLTDAGRLQDDTALSAAQAGRVPRLPAKGAPPGRTAPPNSERDQPGLEPLSWDLQGRCLKLDGEAADHPADLQVF